MRRYRIVLTILGVVACLELVLRFLYGTVPSLSVDTQPFVPKDRPSVVAPGPDLPLCHAPKQDRPPGAGEAAPPPVGWTRELDGVGEPLVLFVVGDSGALGAGVDPEQTYAYRIAGRLQTETSRPVHLYNLGYNAAGYCGYLEELHHHLDRTTPDLVVIHMFADDLEQQALVLTKGELRADPAQVENDVAAWFLSNLYVANWGWWKILKWAIHFATDGGSDVPPWVERGPRLIPKATLDNFGKAMVHIERRLQNEGVAQFSFLTSPAGWGMCPKSPSPTSECGWLAQDMDAMSSQLNEGGVSWVDLRGMWENDFSSVQELEMRFYREQGRLPIHPNAHGHKRIYSNLWPSIQGVWTAHESL